MNTGYCSALSFDFMRVFYFYSIKHFKCFIIIRWKRGNCIFSFVKLRVKCLEHCYGPILGGLMMLRSNLFDGLTNKLLNMIVILQLLSILFLKSVIFFDETDVLHRCLC